MEDETNIPSIVAARNMVFSFIMGVMAVNNAEDPTFTIAIDNVEVIQFNAIGLGWVAWVKSAHDRSMRYEVIHNGDVEKLTISAYRLMTSEEFTAQHIS